MWDFSYCATVAHAVRTNRDEDFERATLGETIEVLFVGRVERRVRADQLWNSGEPSKGAA